jgi:hypothetical protein
LQFKEHDAIALALPRIHGSSVSMVLAHGLAGAIGDPLGLSIKLRGDVPAPTCGQDVRLPIIVWRAHCWVKTRGDTSSEMGASWQFTMRWCLGQTAAA